LPDEWDDSPADDLSVVFVTTEDFLLTEDASDLQRGQAAMTTAFPIVG
jgi:hypothetical protein